MAQGETPVVRTRRLQAEIRRLRDKAGLTQKAVAREMGWSESKVVRMETGTVGISTSDLRALLHFYRVDDARHAEELLEITRHRGKSWWDDYPDKQFRDFLAFEDSAIGIDQFMTLVVPGLLQTEGYMRALFESYMMDEKAIAPAVRTRLHRQELLADRGTRALFVLDEAVIHRWVGGPDVMMEQLIKIRDLDLQPSVEIRIIPFSKGAHRGMIDSFAIFTLPTGESVVNIESPHRDRLISNEPETSKKYVETFGKLREIAIKGKEMRKLIDPVIETMSVAARA